MKWNNQGSTLLVVLSLILFITVIGAGLFALFMQTMPGRIEMREESLVKIQLETVAYDTLNRVEVNTIAGDYPFAGDEAIDAVIETHDNDLFLLIVTYEHEDTPLTLTIVFDYNSDTSVYTIKQKGFSNDA